MSNDDNDMNKQSPVHNVIPDRLQSVFNINTVSNINTFSNILKTTKYNQCH